MAYGTRAGGGGHTIQTFRPDDTADEFFIESCPNIKEILRLAEEKWPGIQPDEINLDARYIHTDCLGYDRFDSTDYTNFLCISASKEYFSRIK